MNVLLVGLGRWGEQHLRVLTALGATVWVAEVSADRRQRAVDRGVAEARVLQDYRDGLASVDAVDIVTPAGTHVDLATTALAAGRHCFVEKPMAVTMEEGRRLVAAAEASRGRLQVGHIFRFHPVTETLRLTLETGRLGRVRYATARFSGFKRPRTDVGVTHTDAIHYFDLFADLLGTEPATVSATQRDFLGRGLDDMSVTTVMYGDVPVVIEANYFAPGMHRDCVIVGERGVVAADYTESTVTLHAVAHTQRSGVWEAVDTGKEDIPVARDEPLRLELRAFLDACAARSRVSVDARAGLRAVAIAEAAARSARLGRVVSLAELDSA